MNMAEWLASLPEWREVTHTASFEANPAHWKRIAERLDENGETRLAAAIRRGITRYERKFAGNSAGVPIILQFHDGSIAKCATPSSPTKRRSKHENKIRAH